MKIDHNGITLEPVVKLPLGEDIGDGLYRPNACAFMMIGDTDIIEMYEKGWKNGRRETGDLICKLFRRDI